MERNQEMRHICRFCSKSFSCGRALGGHMRTHLTTNQSESTEKLSKKKSSTNFIKVDEKEAQNGYSLREKPKKTNKFGDLVEESSFDHHEYLNNSNQKLVLDHSQSDNEEATPIRKQRSRIIKRYKDSTITTNNITTYLHKNNASSSCISEIEQEQEEVALSLILLSRDVTVHWSSSKGKSIVDSSEKSNTEFLEARITQTTLSDSKSESKNINCNDCESVKLKAMKTSKVEISSVDYGCLNSKLKQSEYKDTLISRNGIEIISAQVQDNEFSEDNMIEKAKTKEGNSEIKKQKAKKRKSNAIDDHEKVSVSSKNLSNEKSYSPSFVQESEKRSKYECTFCNKIFHSYQALGGHRASHKKMKSGCFSSKIDSSENSTETDISPIQSTDTKSIAIDGISAEKMKTLDNVSKKNSDKVHECPICFKAFTSGQALGGHKRSHLLVEAKSNNSKKNETTTTDLEKDENNKNKRKNPEIKDFLDLNLPAPEQDEVAESSDRVYCNPWWLGIGSNHQQEQLLGASLIH